MTKDTNVLSVFLTSPVESRNNSVLLLKVFVELSFYQEKMELLKFKNG